ncbi:MAG: hypothetical protein K0R31_781 [Clostridiales bacterium]|jgi:hypothetical protein|nr:hypothetical protein [Clostridiales bacterium]
MATEFDQMALSLGNGFEPPKPQLEFLYRLVVDCAPPIEVGNVEKGFLKIIPIIGGEFEGPKIKGIVLPVGADWNTGNHYNPAFKGIDTRYVLKTDDGAIISLSTKGYVRQTPEVAAARQSRQPVDPTSYYFKQHLFFETSSEKYDWLNGVVAFGCVISKTTPGVIYDAYIVK